MDEENKIHAAQEKEEEENKEDDNALTEKMIEDFAKILRRTKGTNKRIKRYMSELRATEDNLDSDYINLLDIVNEREKELTSVIHSLCQNYRDIIENHRTQMHVRFYEDRKSARDSRQFLKRSFFTIKDILTGQAETPEKLSLMQLETTCSFISKEKFELPHWSMPRMDCIRRRQDDMYTIHGLIGTLSINNNEDSPSRRSSMASDFEVDLYDAMVPGVEHIDDMQEDNADTDSDVDVNANNDEQVERIGDSATAFLSDVNAHGRESDDDSEDSNMYSTDDQSGTDGGGDAEASSALGDSTSSLKTAKRKKRRKCLGIGYALLSKIRHTMKRAFEGENTFVEWAHKEGLHAP